MFNDIFIELLQNKQITAYKLSKELNISETLISQWKSGRQLPKYDSINMLADYFDCSSDYLLGRTKMLNTNENDIKLLNKTEVSTQAPPQIQKVGRNISVEDQSTLDLYLQLDLYDKGEIRGEMKQMLKADKYREEILEKNA